MSSIGTPDMPFSPNQLELQFNHLKVLLVDHSPDSLYLSTAVLESYSMDVMAVPSAAQALVCLLQFRPQLLITELCLPEYDGYFLLDNLRGSRDNSLSLIPAIALTTQASAQDRRQALAAGFQKHIAKPYLIEELIAAIVDLFTPDCL